MSCFHFSGSNERVDAFSTALRPQRGRWNNSSCFESWKGGNTVKNTIITTTDGKRLDTKTTIDFFNDFHCPTLVGKLKIFILKLAG